MQERTPPRPPRAPRLCLVCEACLTDDPRARTCSGAHRVWLSRAGGAGPAGISSETGAARDGVSSLAISTAASEPRSPTKRPADSTGAIYSSTPTASRPPRTSRTLCGCAERRGPRCGGRVGQLARTRDAPFRALRIGQRTRRAARRAARDARGDRWRSRPRSREARRAPPVARRVHQLRGARWR